MLKEIKSEHVKVFAERYDQLYVAARSLVNNDPGEARDLVHDALIAFVRHSPDLQKVNNIDGYLYTLIRNLVKAKKRRMNIHPIYELPIGNYNSAETGLAEALNWRYNPQPLLQLQDVLRVICEYACFRKESVKLGSALILRYFHGYHTSEIAQIMKVTASSVSQLLKLARAEVHLYLNDPKHLNFSHDVFCVRNSLGLNYGCLSFDLVDELRCAVFRSSYSRNCLLQFKLHKLYGDKGGEGIDCKTLAHIVSCAPCLDAVNTFIGLESLSMRYPTDTLGKRAKKWNIPRLEVMKRKTVTRRAILSSVEPSYGD
jgi:RNA polymerase sigma factor (sigma-70 family)